MAVGSGVGVGDRLEGPHVVPEIVGSDAGHQLARRVVDAVSAAGSADPVRGGRRRRGGLRRGEPDDERGDRGYYSDPTRHSSQKSGHSAAPIIRGPYSPFGRTFPPSHTSEQ